MTPDLKRLCEAASNVELGLGADCLRDWEAEAVVRAVLAALREQMMGEVIGSETDLWTAADPQRLYPGTEGFDHQFANVINHILGEPATA